MSTEILKGHAKFIMGISSPEQLTEWLTANQMIIGFCFVGRSNVGKSSLINTLFGRTTAKISKTPGRTREINIFTFNLETDGKINKSLPKFYLFDLPGYGHAQVSKTMSKQWNELMAAFFELIPSGIKMINLQDARHPNQSADIDFQKFIRNLEIEASLVFNKIDKLRTQKERAKLEKLKPELFRKIKWARGIHFVSAEKKNGMKELHDSMISFLLQKEKIYSSL